MQRTVYYLCHRDTGERLRYYSSLAGARIAQHARNSHLGFRNRIERVEQFQNWEVELFAQKNGSLIEGTWVIVEDTIEQQDL